MKNGWISQLSLLSPVKSGKIVTIFAVLALPPGKER
jgi:hypothetical protein